MTGLSLELPPDVLDAIAERVITRLEERGDLLNARERDRWLRGAAAIADYIASPPSRVFALSSARRIPVERDGSALIARTSALDAWLKQGGGRRP